MAIYRKLHEIQSSVRGLTKDKNAYNYDYVTGDKLLSHIRPMMCERNLLLLPSVTGVQSQVITYDIWDKCAKGMVKKTEVLYVVMMEMKWVDAEDGEVLIEKWAGTGQNAFDKGFGSALTYGERYYLLKTFHIPTDKDDVDAIAEARDKALEQTYVQQVQPAQPAPQEQPAQAAAPQRKTIELDTYWNFVECAAKGIKTKTGMDMRERFIKGYNPSPELLAGFDKDVADYRKSNQL